MQQSIALYIDAAAMLEQPASGRIAGCLKAFVVSVGVLFHTSHHGQVAIMEHSLHTTTGSRASVKTRQDLLSWMRKSASTDGCDNALFLSECNLSDHKLQPLLRCLFFVLFQFPFELLLVDCLLLSSTSRLVLPPLQAACCLRSYWMPRYCQTTPLRM